MLSALWVFLAGLGLVFLAGIWTKAKVKAAYPPTGRMADVGGYRLHVQCQGQGAGEPTVVFDAGQGDFSLSWAGIASRVAAFAHVCAYDRAGLGWSDPSPKPRTAEVMVEELRTLLAEAGVPGPYVLVGASTGGMNVRLFAHKYPSEVAGLVLVDAAHEEQFSASLEETFTRLQVEMAALSSKGKLVVAERSGHAIHLDQPELVVDAVREVVEAARARLRPHRTVPHAPATPAGA